MAWKKDELMTCPDAIASILRERQPLTPAELRDIIKERFPELHETKANQNSVARGNHHDLDHALLAPISTVVRQSENFVSDRAVRPLGVPLAIDSEAPLPADSPTLDELESGSGSVHLLGTGTFTRDGREIVKIGFTARSIGGLIARLYTTDLPFVFTVIREFKTKNCIELEQAFHRLLLPICLNQTTEFFTAGVIPYVERILHVHQEIQGEP